MAAIPLVEIDTAMLERDVQQLRQTLSRAKTHINALQEKMNAMNSMWEGPSKAAIQGRFRTDHQRMLELCDTLDELIQTLVSIRKAYDDCEERVFGAVNALRL